MKSDRVVISKNTDAGTIAVLADMVMAGQIVEACLTDGTFVALLNELNRRGYVLHPRADSDPVKWLKPFLFKVSSNGYSEPA